MTEKAAKAPKTTLVLQHDADDMGKPSAFPAGARFQWAMMLPPEAE